MNRPVILAAALLTVTATIPAAASQRCPPNSHAAAVGLPGNLRTAQCFCNRGFVSVNGVCMPIVRSEPRRPRPAGPAGQLVAPQR